MQENRAPQAYADWLSGHAHPDRRPDVPFTYRYHSRSDAHSIAICELVMADLLAACGSLRHQAEAGEVAYGTNVPFTFPASGKAKTLDLAIGVPLTPGLLGIEPVQVTPALRDLRLAMEAKSVMTEHKKSQPRVFDELSSSHQIVHSGGDRILAAGLTVVNIADSFVSPLRQAGGQPLFVTRHRQPDVAASMINHLRGLRIRDHLGEVGFDAYTTIVISTNNLEPATLWTAPPAPQPGDPDHYDTFIARLVDAYAARFGP